MATSAQLLEIEGLSVTFAGRSRSVRAVQNLDLTVDSGEALALVGESGSGKSVTASSIVGLLPRSGVAVSGRIRLDGTDLLGLGDKELNRIRGKQIGTIFQNPATSLDPSFKVGKQMVEVIRHHLMLTTADALVLAAEWLERVRISDASRVLGAYPHELSGGMKQRVMIAMACIPSPALLIADEPTTALDPTIQRQVLDLLANIRQELGIALLLVTHDFGVVSYLADSVAVLRRGRLVESGRVDAVLSSPEHPYTRLLIESVPKLRMAPKSPLRDDEDGDSVGSDKIVPQRDVILAVEDVSKGFIAKGTGLRKAEITVLSDVTIEVRRGESIGLIGESGSGKSTLARVIAGLLMPSEGRVIFDGIDIASLSGEGKKTFRRGLQIVFQDHGSALNPRLRIGGQLIRPIVRLGVESPNGSDATDQAVNLLERVGLDSSYLRRYPHQLSGGQRQRIGIARALGVGPKLIILDEPTSALDVSTQAQILELLGQLKQSLDLTFILIAHNLGVVQQFSDRVVVLNSGRVVDTFAADDFGIAARHQATKDLVNAVLPLRTGFNAVRDLVT